MGTISDDAYASAFAAVVNREGDVCACLYMPMIDFLSNVRDELAGRGYLPGALTDILPAVARHLENGSNDFVTEAGLVAALSDLESELREAIDERLGGRCSREGQSEQG